MKNAYSVFVFGDYDIFLPYYIYSIEKAYPDTDIVIFYNDTISVKVKNYIQTKSFVILYENFYKEYSFFNKYKMRGGGGLTLLRYLIPGKYFKNYTNVYFGDVDVFILKDKENLFSFHEKQINKAGYPFSNRVRKLPNNEPSKRLTGLHFVCVKPYFKQMDQIINEILDNEIFREKVISNVIRDEEFSYLITKKIFQFNPGALINNKSPLHGFHLGVFRGNKTIHPHEIRDNTLMTYKEIKSQFTFHMKEKEMKKIVYDFYCPEMIRTLIYFDIDVPLFLKLKYTTYKLYENSFIRKVLRKIKTLMLK